jgi:arylsulfatase A-like enzyme
VTATRPPNVLLVVLDCVRRRNTTLAGYRRDTTPFLSRVAAGATTYTQARAPSTWTLPSHASMFTGLAEPEHRLTVERRLDPAATVVADLAGRGYATGAFSGNVFLTEHPTGLADPFGTVVGPGDVPDDADGFAYADRLLDWRAAVDEPWFACLNLMDAHRPFEPRPDYDAWGAPEGRRLQDRLPDHSEWVYYGEQRPMTELHLLADLYDGGIRQADAVLERVVETLRETGELARTLLVVTADHGEGFGESTELPGSPVPISHGLGVNEELLHVPLVVKPPGDATARTVDAPATLARLPSVVRRVVDRGVDGDGDDQPEVGFVPPDGSVVAGRARIDDDLRELAARCADPARFDGRMRAAYEVASDGAGGTALYKHVGWGDHRATIRFVGAEGRQLLVDDAPTDGGVDAAFAAFEDRGVAVDRADGDDGNDAVTRRLRDLGYLG